jgi:HK97 family phage major capsid protein
MPSIEQIREKVSGKLQTFQNYAFQIDREADVDPEARTVKLAFASDKPIDNWMYGAIKLQMKKSSIRTARLDSGAPLLMDHNTRDVVGVIDDYSFDKDGIARATVRFGESVRAQEIFNDVRTGIRQNVSVGFMIWDLQLESKGKDAPTIYRADDWEPYEISIVAVPADISVGVGRSIDDEPETVLEVPAIERAIPTTEENNMTPEEIAAAKAAEETRSAAAINAQRETELVAWAGIFGDKGTEIARTMLAENGSVTQDDIRIAIRAAQPPTIKGPVEDPTTLAGRSGGVELARSLPRYGVLRNFTGDKAAERAYRFGQWFLAARGIEANKSDRGIFARATKFCAENGIVLDRAMSEGVNESGGFTVPQEFGNDLIDLREMYGVFRRNAKMVPMASDTRSDPRRTGGLTAYFEGEGDAITASDKGWDRVSLTAKKLAVLGRYSSELNEDSIINMADDLAGEIAYAFALKEDQCGFIGDATSTYGGIIGVAAKLLALSGTIANIAGLQVASGNAYSEVVLTDFLATMGRLPVYADTPNAKWYMHKSVYWNVAAKLVTAAGGVTAAELEGKRGERLLGYPVEFVQVMPSVEANSQVMALFGDLALAASFGSRRDTTIAISEHSRFANDQLEIRGTERFDINVHDVGNASATAGLRVPGPIVGLITAAS